MLAIETSGFAGSVALLYDNGTCASRALPQSGRRHAQSLVQEIDRLFEAEQIDRFACQAVAVSIGPGSFTGLRVGVVCAKTWAYAAGCDIVAVDTFQAIAESSPSDADTVYVLGDAQRGDLFVGEYHRSAEHRWERDAEIAIVPAERWIDERESTDWVTGPALEKWESQLNERCRVVEASRRQPTAEGIARIGKWMFDTGATADVWSLEPFYLRRSAAEEKWDATHGTL